MVTILVLTMRPGNLGAHRPAWQLLPFGDLLAALPDDVSLIRLALADLVTNIILFAPLGAATALRWPGVATRRVVLSAAAFSTAIEITQGVTGLGRMAQSTDVLMNAFGAWLGWLSVRRVLRSRASRADRLSAAVPRRR